MYQELGQCTLLISCNEWFALLSSILYNEVPTYCLMSWAACPPSNLVYCIKARSLLSLSLAYFFSSIRIYVHHDRVHRIHEITETNSSMYPSYNLDLDLVLQAIGVHLEEFLVVTCRPSASAFCGMQISSSVFQSHCLTGSISGDDQEETCVKRRVAVEVSFCTCR